jgi:hypothetical protein
VIGFHSCVIVESLLISLSIEVLICSVEEHCLLRYFHGDINYRYLLGLCTV